MASRAAAAADEIDVELLPFIRLYKSGRIERLIGSDPLPASLDAATGVASKDVTIDPATNLSVRLYLPPTATGAGDKLPIIVYFHGGGFMVESAKSAMYHRYLTALAARVRAVAVSVDYRRVPEHRLPAAYDDSWAALAWAVASASASAPDAGGEAEPWLAEHGDPSRVFLAGDSAGGNIAHNVAMRAAAEGLPAHDAAIKGVLLMHPYFWDASNAMGAALEDRIWREWRFMTGNDDAQVDDPRLAPTPVALALMPAARVLVAVAGEDFLAPKGRAYYAALLASGWRGEAELVDTPAEGHVFYLQQPETAAAAKVMDRVAAFIARG